MITHNRPSLSELVAGGLRGNTGDCRQKHRWKWRWVGCVIIIKCSISPIWDSRWNFVHLGPIPKQRLRLIATGKFIDVETETYRDWEMLRLSRPRPIKTGQKMLRPRSYRESPWSLLPLTCQQSKSNQKY